MTTAEKIDDGGPAFPIADERAPDGTGIRQGSDGNSKRDWFAGMALTGMLTGTTVWNGDSPRRIAIEAYEIADAMLAERAKATGTRANDNGHLIAAASELYETLASVEREIGWRSTGPTDRDHYYCEFCGHTHADADLIPHKPDCLVTNVRAILAKARGEQP